MGQLIEDAGFGEGKLAFQQMLVQQADLAGVEAIEAAHGFGARQHLRIGRHVEDDLFA
ncbi:hypothetical protein D3C86_1741260 [compost metagenome]